MPERFRGIVGKDYLYLNGTSLDGTITEKKSLFFELMAEKVHLLPAPQYLQASKGLEPVACGASWFRFISHDLGEIRLVNASIFIDIDAHIVGDQDFSDLIPLTIWHEINELWYIYKNGFHPDSPPSVAHWLALLAEYQHAFELGLAEKRLYFLHLKVMEPSITRGFAEAIIRENEQAYAKVRSRLIAPNQNFL